MSEKMVGIIQFWETKTYVGLHAGGGNTVGKYKTRRAIPDKRLEETDRGITMCANIYVLEQC